jgi:hypothetical protein
MIVKKERKKTHFNASKKVEEKACIVVVDVLG